MKAEPWKSSRPNRRHKAMVALLPALITRAAPSETAHPMKTLSNRVKLTRRNDMDNRLLDHDNMDSSLFHPANDAEGVNDPFWDTIIRKLDEGWALPRSRRRQHRYPGGRRRNEEIVSVKIVPDPTSLPSFNPTRSPSKAPTHKPSNNPTSVPSGSPSALPTARPTALPSAVPTGDPSFPPSSAPSDRPTLTPSDYPSGEPSKNPSLSPSYLPSEGPTTEASVEPTSEPSDEPSIEPTLEPSITLSISPSWEASMMPSDLPSVPPSMLPTGRPTSFPSLLPSVSARPSALPTVSSAPSMSAEPSVIPSDSPSGDPSGIPSFEPSEYPSMNMVTCSPSSVPSEMPSVEPSAGPTGAPSGEPSAVPTEAPSVEPTMRLTGSPSGEPSNIPSSNPSGMPSADPTVTQSGAPSVISSASPSGHPSKEPSGAPTFLPSESPSGRPSTSPTHEASRTPSAVPTSIPTERPSAFPTPTPTSVPTSMPSFSPTGYPTRYPTSDPTSTPTAYPTSNPTAVPTSTPTANPTSNPTADPTAYPTSTPTFVPSSAPSSSPTFRPSTVPSLSPSTKCHDLATYRSPINGLTCSQHAGTDCASWGFLGLSDAALVELMESCPVSCRTNCEAYSYEPSASPLAAPSSQPSVSVKVITGKVSFYIHSVSGPLDPTTLQSVENGMFTFFDEYVNENDGSSSTQLVFVAIQTQEVILDGEDLRRHLRSQTHLPVNLGHDFNNGWPQRRAPGEVTLRLNATAEAKSRFLDGTMLSALLASAMNSSDAFKIFGGDVFFDDAILSLSRMQRVKPDYIDSSASGKDESGSGAPTAAIVISSISVVLVAGLATGYFFKKRKDAQPERENGAFMMAFSPKSFSVMSDDGNHPGIIDTGADVMKHGSIFSYEESPCNRSAGPLPVMAISALLGSRSRDLTGSCSSQEVASVPQKMEYDQPDPKSPDGSVVTFIPPMIVIDNIDLESHYGDERDGVVKPKSSLEGDETEKPNVSDNVRRIEASSQLAKALASNTVQLSEVMTCSTANNIDAQVNEKLKVPSSPDARSNRSLRMGDSDSVASTPVMTFTKGDIPLRRALSSGDLSLSSLSRSDPAHALNQLLQKNFSNLGDTKGGSSDESSAGDVRRGIHDIILGNPFQNDEASQSASEASFLFQPQEIVSPPSTARASPRSESDVCNSIEDHFAELQPAFSSPTRDKNSSPSNRKLREIFMLKKRMTIMKQKKDGDNTQLITDAHGADQTVLSQQISEDCFSNSSPKKDTLQPNDREEDTSNQQAGLFSNFRPWSKKTSSPMTAEEIAGNNYRVGNKSLHPDSMHRRIHSDEGAASPAGVRDRGEYQYTFPAPSIGKLGIIIHKTMVHAVKDYSPLFGKLEPGDRIIRIDEESTQNMTTGEVTQLLARKRSIKGTKKGSTIHITVISQRQKPRFRCDIPYGVTKDELEECLTRSRSVDPLLMEELRGLEPYSPQFFQAEDFSRDQSPSLHPSPERSKQSNAEAWSAGGYSEAEEADQGFHLLGAIVSSDDEDDGFHVISKDEQDTAY